MRLETLILLAEKCDPPLSQGLVDLVSRTSANAETDTLNEFAGFSGGYEERMESLRDFVDVFFDSG